MSPELETLILRCLRKAPAVRYPDADALGEAIVSFAGVDPIAGPAPGRGGSPGPSWPRVAPRSPGAWRRCSSTTASGWTSESDGYRLVERALVQRADAIFLDLDLSSIDGLDAGMILRGAPETSGVPIALLSDRRDRDVVVHLPGAVHLHTPFLELDVLQCWSACRSSAGPRTSPEETADRAGRQAARLAWCSGRVIAPWRSRGTWNDGRIPALRTECSRGELWYMFTKFGFSSQASPMCLSCTIDVY